MSEHPSDDTLESLGAEDTWEQEDVIDWPDKAEALKARLSKTEDALTLLHKYPFHSADCRCKQWGGKIDPENCGQCRAREALAALPEHLK